MDSEVSFTDIESTEQIEISDLPEISIDNNGQERVSWLKSSAQQDRENSKRNGFFNSRKFKKWKFVILMTIEGWIEFSVASFWIVWLLKEGEYFLGFLLMFAQVFPSVFLVGRSYKSDLKFGIGRILLSTFPSHLSLLPCLAIYYSSKFGYLAKIKKLRILHRTLIGPSIILTFVCLIALGLVKIPQAFTGFVYSNPNAKIDCGWWPFVAILYFSLTTLRSFPMKPFTLEFESFWISLLLAISILLYRISALAVIICIAKEFSILLFSVIIVLHGIYYWKEGGILSESIYGFFSIVQPTITKNCSYINMVVATLIGNITILACLVIVYLLHYSEAYNPWCKVDLQRMALEEEWVQKLTWLWIPLFATSTIPLVVQIWTKRYKKIMSSLLLVSMYAFSLMALLLTSPEVLKYRREGATTIISNQTLITNYQGWSSWERSNTGVPVRFRTCSGVTLKQLDQRKNKDLDILTDFEDSIKHDKYFKIRLLIKTGVSANYRNSRNISAIGSALEHKSLKVARVLIEQGADINGLEDQIALAFNKTLQQEQKTNRSIQVSKTRFQKSIGSLLSNRDYICYDPLTDNEKSVKAHITKAINVISLPLATLGITLNTIAIVTFTLPEMACLFTEMLACLAVFDTGFLLLHFVVDVNNLFGPIFYNYEYFYAYFLYPFIEICTFCSVYMTVSISFERFRAVVWPVEYKMSSKSRTRKIKLAICASVISTLAFLYVFPRFLAHKMSEQEVDGVKMIVRTKSDFGSTYYYHFWYEGFFDNVVFSGLPLFLLVFLNVKIYLVLSKQKNRKEIIEKNIPVLYGIVILHILTQIPWFLYDILSASLHSKLQISFGHGCSDELPLYVQTFCLSPFFPYIVNGSVNFFIYYYSNNTFRLILKKKFRSSIRF